jgi:hypothetical protein
MIFNSVRELSPGTPERVHEKGVEIEVWNELCSGAPWRRRGSIVSDTRFFSSVRESRSEDRVWHSRYFAYALACIEFDLLHGQKFKDFFKLKKAAPLVAATDADKEATLKSAVQQNQVAVRASCANLLVLAAMMYSSDSNQHLERIILKASLPLEKWHSEQNLALRKMDSSLTWPLEQMSGRLIGVALELADGLRDACELPRLGFTVLMDMKVAAQWAKKHEKAKLIDTEDNEDYLAATLGNLTLAMISNFLNRMVWFFRGWPMGSVKMLSDDLRDETMKQLKDDHEQFEFLVSSANADHKPLARRSCFQCVPVQHVLGMVQEEEGIFTPRLAEALRRKHSRICMGQRRV